MVFDDDPVLILDHGLAPRYCCPQSYRFLILLSDSSLQELEEKARLQRELEELRGNKGSTVRSIRKELEEINMGVAIREGEEREEVRVLLFILRPNDV